ncbi:MAG: YncE family protein [Candidatus Alcyoniella australis]|nr:YncE family protein [Candidatus Alcyoniella australis]
MSKLRISLIAALLASMLLVGCATEDELQQDTGDLLDNPLSVVVFGRYALVVSANFDQSHAGEGTIMSIDLERLEQGKGAILDRIAGPAYMGRAVVDSAGEIAYVADRAGDQILLLDVSNPSDLRWIDLDTSDDNPSGIAAGREPFDLVLGPDEVYLYATNVSSGDLSIIDLGRRELARNMLLASGVVNLGIQPGSDYLYVTNKGLSAIVIFDVARNEFVTSFTISSGERTIGYDTRGIAFSPDGRWAYICSRVPDALLVIDTEKIPNQPDEAIWRIIPMWDSPSGVAVSADGSEIWVTNFDSECLIVVDAQTLDVIARIDVGRGPYDVALTAPDAEDGRFYALVPNFYAHSLSIVDSVARKQVGRIR